MGLSGFAPAYSNNLKQNDMNIDEFVAKWCLKSMKCKKGDDYIMYDEEGCLIDFISVIKTIIPSEIDQVFAKSHWIEEEPARGYCNFGFDSGANWFRSYVLEQLKGKQ